MFLWILVLLFAEILSMVSLPRVFRSYFFELAPESGLHCRDDHKLSFTKPFLLQTAEYGKGDSDFQEFVDTIVHSAELESHIDTAAKYVTSYGLFQEDLQRIWTGAGYFFTNL